MGFRTDAQDPIAWWAPLAMIVWLRRLLNSLVRVHRWVSGRFDSYRPVKWVLNLPVQGYVAAYPWGPMASVDATGVHPRAIVSPIAVLGAGFRDNRRHRGQRSPLGACVQK